MKKTLSYLLPALLATLMMSCKSKEPVKYDIIINDTANCLSESDKTLLQSADLPAGYQFVVETVSDIEKGKLAKHPRKQRKYYKKQYKEASEFIIITYIRNYGFIMTKMPETLQNYIDINNPAEYFVNQKQGGIPNMINFINSNIAEYDKLSGFKKQVFSQSVISVLDSLFLQAVPSDSLLYKIIFYIPLHIASWIFAVFQSIFWSMAFILLLLIGIQYYIWKHTKRGLKMLIIYQIISVIFVLVAFSFYSIITPRMEHVWLFDAYGFSSAFSTGVDNYFTGYQASTAPWILKFIFCLFMIIQPIISNPDNMSLSLCTPKFQKEYYQNNTTVYDKVAATVNANLDQLPDVDYDKEDAPYTAMVGQAFGKGLKSLFFTIPLCLFAGKNVIIILVAILLIIMIRKITYIILGLTYLRKIGALQFFK